MNTTAELLARLEAQSRDPKFQEAQKRRAEEVERANRAALAAAQRVAVTKLGIPLKDLELIGAGKLERTAAVVALDEPPSVTVLSGGAGTGKTVAASAWLHRMVFDDANWTTPDDFTPPRFRGSGLFVTAARLSRWGRYSDKEMGTLISPARLVIDDLGTEFLDEKGALLSLLDEVVNERYANRRATVLTTNQKLGTFRQRYGERIADRIREAGCFLALGETSLRAEGGPRAQVALPRLAAVPDRETGADDDDEREPAYDGWRKSK